MVKITSQIEVGLIAKRAVFQLSNRSSLIISNMSDTATLFYGGDNTVTVDNGVPIRPSTDTSFMKGLGDRPDLERWIIADTPGVDVRIGEEVEKESEDL